MNIKTYQNLSTNQQSFILKIWNEEYPEQLTYKSINELNAYISGLDNGTHFLVINDNQEVFGWACKFYRDSQIWFVIILSNVIQNQGWGSKLLNKIIENEIEVNGWVVDNSLYKKADGSLYQSPLLFYYKNGFVPFPEIRLERQDLSAIKILYRNSRTH